MQASSPLQVPKPGDGARHPVDLPVRRKPAGPQSFRFPWVPFRPNGFPLGDFGQLNSKAGVRSRRYSASPTLIDPAGLWRSPDTGAWLNREPIEWPLSPRTGQSAVPHLQAFRYAAYSSFMIVWFVLTLVLLIWNAVYCGLKIAADFRGPKPANGVWGLFALAAHPVVNRLRRDRHRGRFLRHLNG